MRLVLAVSLAFLSCIDETVSGFADTGAVYRLIELDGQRFDAKATITFPEEGRISGVAPCNDWSATQGAPYPWFAPGPIAVTRRACPDLLAETRFLQSLSAMTLAEVQGNVLILSNEAGLEMVFERG